MLKYSFSKNEVGVKNIKLNISEKSFLYEKDKERDYIKVNIKYINKQEEVKFLNENLNILLSNNLGERYTKISDIDFIEKRITFNLNKYKEVHFESLGFENDYFTIMTDLNKFNIDEEKDYSLRIKLINQDNVSFLYFNAKKYSSNNFIIYYEENEDFDKDFLIECLNKNNLYIDLFDDFYKSDFDISFLTEELILKIPIKGSSALDLYRTDNIKELILNDKKSKLIGNFNDYEKNKYKLSDGNKILDGLKINLHLIERSYDNWVRIEDGFWNGVVKDKDTIQFKNNFFFNNDKAEFQSDLLGFLNFNNNDIKFNKSRVRGTFLRLSFYDSPNQYKQNLLYYSTIFLDGNKLYKKFLVNQNLDGYNVYDDKLRNYDSGYKGIRVDREYNFENYDIEKLEEMRLSSQFSAYGIGRSEKTSEGFYLYLWRKLREGIKKGVLYMKVELNHAGVGKTIPLIMPYFIERVDLKKGIKTFNQIVADWQNEESRYDINLYKEYSYIKLKYQYNEDINDFIYYLDEEIYGEEYKGKNIINNVLYLNLFEGKIV